MEDVEEFNIHEGFIGLVKPECEIVEYIDFRYETTDEGKQGALIKLIEIITGKPNGKITNAGFLPKPFEDFTMFMNFEQFDNDDKYNLGFYGNPMFGNLVFLCVDKDTEEGTIYPIPESKKEYLSKIIKNLKQFEINTGIYDAMTKVDKNEFLKEFVAEQTNVLKESTKNVEGENSEELKKAKEELENTEKKYQVVRIDFDTENKDGEVIESFYTRDEAFDFINTKSEILSSIGEEAKKKIKMEGSMVGESPDNSVYYKIIKS